MCVCVFVCVRVCVSYIFILVIGTYLAVCEVWLTWCNLCHSWRLFIEYPVGWISSPVEHCVNSMLKDLKSSHSINNPALCELYSRDIYTEYLKIVYDYIPFHCVTCTIQFEKIIFNLAGLQRVVRYRSSRNMEVASLVYSAPRNLCTKSLTNSMAYGTQRFNAAFTRALQ